MLLGCDLRDEVGWKRMVIAKKVKKKTGWSSYVKAVDRVLEHFGNEPV